MHNRTIFKQPFTWVFSIFTLVFIILIIFTLVNDKFYSIPIAKVTDVEQVACKQVTDEHHNRDTKHTQKLTLKMLNGQFEGQTTTINNTYSASQADSEKYSKNNKLLLHVGESLKRPYVLEKKRDTLVVTMTGIFLLTILWVGKRIGLYSILSLILTTLAVLSAIAIHNIKPEINLFAMMALAVIIATVSTLVLVLGWNTRTWVTIGGTLLGTFLCVGIMYIVIQTNDGNGLKFETMGFLTLPPKEIFLASVMIGTLGAVMDVAITISSGMAEILRRNPTITLSRWALAGRRIGQDIMGTMTNILLFSYLSGALPMFLIYLKNANTITYSISMNWSLEISRAITGGIGIVLTIPITILLMQLWWRMGGAKR
ncbi:YibE/F family protein [Staphylococcus sp. SQ8-PEA]|uniref:YibE/F family protein n=1 Tax=Staphylococcus marylandisciuri TaxID=2981529 RepID=A0ABT2QSR1_9STAP|nr:YibE/F family protein [Staphylococcus marylandisciuri]MCU5746994.1 YibE/F family protein [Staphylococcus marylandisciuri]